MYIAQIKQRDGKYGEFLSGSISKKDIEAMLANVNERGYANFTINQRKETGKYGETHSMVLTEIEELKPTKQASKEEITIDDIPF